MAEVVLAKEIDKQGTELIIKFGPTLGSTPVVPVFLHEYAAHIEKGFAYNYMIASNMSKVIYATIGGEVAGFIIFDYQNDIPKTLWINFGAVVDKYKNRGIYSILHRHLEKSAKANGSKKIHSFVHINNTAMLEASKKIGKQPVFYRVEMDIE